MGQFAIVLSAAFAAVMPIMADNNVAGGEPGGVQLWENGPCWADRNIGAAKPEGHGLYFWWGDTVGYKCKNNA